LERVFTPGRLREAHPGASPSYPAFIGLPSRSLEPREVHELRREKTARRLTRRMVADFIGHVPLGAVVGIRLEPDPQTGMCKALFKRVSPRPFAEYPVPFGIVGPIGPDRDELISVITWSHKTFYGIVVNFFLIIVKSADSRNHAETKHPTYRHTRIIHDLALADFSGDHSQVSTLPRQGRPCPGHTVGTVLKSGVQRARGPLPVTAGDQSPLLMNLHCSSRQHVPGGADVARYLSLRAAIRSGIDKRARLWLRQDSSFRIESGGPARPLAA